MQKTGAQLQAFLAGKLEDPIRLCDECAKGEQRENPPSQPARRSQSGATDLVASGEVMPCVVPGCEGSWLYTPGMQLARARAGEVPRDRQCESCRTADVTSLAEAASEAVAVSPPAAVSSVVDLKVGPSSPT